MNLHQKREAIMAAVEAGAMPREVADKIVAADRPARAEFAVRAFGDGIEGDAGADVVRAGELVLYDAIHRFGGVWGISANDVRAGLAELADVEELTVRINSPGGDVRDGFAIHNMIADHPAKVTVMVDGAAASVASVIALAGDTITMNRGAQIMIHEAHGVAVGDADEVAGYAERLDRASAMAAEFYANRAGGTIDEWRDRMRAETWLYADEAVALGLADEVVPMKTKPGSADEGAEIAALWDSVLSGKNADREVVESTSEASPDASGVSAATAADAHARLRADRVVAGMKLQRIAAELAHH